MSDFVASCRRRSLFDLSVAKNLGDLGRISDSCCLENTSDGLMRIQVNALASGRYSGLAVDIQAWLCSRSSRSLIRNLFRFYWGVAVEDTVTLEVTCKLRFLGRVAGESSHSHPARGCQSYFPWYHRAEIRQLEIDVVDPKSQATTTN